MVTVKVLGAGCTKCKALEQRLNDIKTRHNLEIEIVKITQLDEIMNYGVMMTPGLVINEKLRSSGKVPDENQLLKWIEEA
ncbi:MAG: thioredoxin family protein [Calditrichaceae bacterium]